MPVTLESRAVLSYKEVRCEAHAERLGLTQNQNGLHRPADMSGSPRIFVTLNRVRENGVV